MPALDMEKPKTATAGTASHIVAVAIAATVASAPTIEPARATCVRSEECARWPSQRPPKRAPAPIDDARIESPPAPELNTSATISGEQLAQRPPTDADCNQQHEQRGNSGVRSRIPNAGGQVANQAPAFVQRRTNGRMRMRASASKKAR